MQYTDVMLDLEILGTAPGSVILSIGAVAFNMDMSEAEWNVFEAQPIGISSSRAAGLEIDEGTLGWWLKQSPEVLSLLQAALDETAGFTVASALSEFAEWYPDKAVLWGNGANFDNVLLRSAFNVVGYRVPWNYYDDRCYRTLKNLFKNVPPPVFQGVKHDAVADALHQTRHLVAILRYVKKCRYRDAEKSAY